MKTNSFAKHVYRAVDSFRVYGGRGIDSAYDGMSIQDREDFDSHLVATQNPLAYVPGTNESRFRSYVRSIVTARAVSEAK